MPTPKFIVLSPLIALALASYAKDSPPVFSAVAGIPPAETSIEKGKGYELALPKGWSRMPGVGPEMKKGDEFKLYLEWPGIYLTGQVKDTSGFKIWGFEFGNLRAVFQKPGKGGAFVLFSSTGGTRGSIEAGIKRYLDGVVPDNRATSNFYRVKPDATYPQIQFHECRLVKQGEPVTFEAIRGWSWSFSRMYTFVAFYPTDQGPGAVSKAEKDAIIAEIVGIVRSLK
jgi:hypothetical protein